jgi:hypothetical protein
MHVLLFLCHIELYWAAPGLVRRMMISNEPGYLHAGRDTQCVVMPAPAPLHVVLQ